MHSRSTGSPAFRHGIRFGILLGIVQIALSLFTAYGNGGNSASILSTAGVAVAVIIYLLAGLLAASRTGRVGTGSFAGLWTGIIGFLIGFFGALVISSMNIDRLRQNAQVAAQAAAGQIHQAVALPVTNQALLLAALMAGVLGILLSLVLGLMLGAIGGLIGRAFFRPVLPPTAVPQNEGTTSRKTPTSPPEKEDLIGPGKLPEGAAGDIPLPSSEPEAGATLPLSVYSSIVEGEVIHKDEDSILTRSPDTFTPKNPLVL